MVQEESFFLSNYYDYLISQIFLMRFMFFIFDEFAKILCFINSREVVEQAKNQNRVNEMYNQHCIRLPIFVKHKLDSNWKSQSNSKICNSNNGFYRSLQFHKKRSLVQNKLFLITYRRYFISFEKNLLLSCSSTQQYSLKFNILFSKFQLNRITVKRLTK